jgi:hypothetical protein
MGRVVRWRRFGSGRKLKGGDGHSAGFMTFGISEPGAEHEKPHALRGACLNLGVTQQESLGLFFFDLDAREDGLWFSGEVAWFEEAPF